MKATRERRYGDSLVVPEPPAGVRLVRDETCLRVITPLPWRRFAIGVMAALSALAGSALAFAWREQPDHGLALVAWWTIVPVSALVVVACASLIVAVMTMRRVVVLTPGVLVVRHGRGRLRSQASCLREAVRWVGIAPEPDGRGTAVSVQAELSPTALRLLTSMGAKAETLEDDEVAVAVVPVCHGEREEVARFLARVIADWAEVELES